MWPFFCLLIQPKTLAVNGTPRIAPASLWTRPKVQEFIQHVKSDPSSVLVVGRGETMTVRVPTHEGGRELWYPKPKGSQSRYVELFRSLTKLFLN